MTRHYHTFLAAAVLTAGLTSCIKDEALNAECDITDVDSLWVSDHRSILVGDPIVSNDRVSFSIKKGTDRTAQAPAFYLTPGATITPASGTERDFSSPQTYTVSSEDGKWSKDYTVSFNYPRPISTCSFEHFEVDTKYNYQKWYEMDADDATNPRRDYWATGNAGYAFVGIAKSPTEFPTVSEPLGYHGNAIRLTTLGTGSYGELLPDPMPIAAGSIFLGEFRSAYATMRPRAATRFGLQLVAGKPLYLEGWYKYTAASPVIDKNKTIHEELADSADIYAVVYEVDADKFVPLNGDNVLTSERIVSMARIADPGEPQEWTYFREPFRACNGKTFDEQRLNSDGYAIAIVATSSRAGAYFTGAIGSTLYVDELRIVWEGDEE